MSNGESKIVQVANDIDSKLQLVKVLNCPITHLLLADKGQ
jgi:hypothetical protein